MRIIPKKFTGFVCGQYSTPQGETLEGVMEYRRGTAVVLHVPKLGVSTSKLYNTLKKRENKDTFGVAYAQELADLRARMIWI